MRHAILSTLLSLAAVLPAADQADPWDDLLRADFHPTELPAEFWDLPPRRAAAALVAAAAEQLGTEIPVVFPADGQPPDQLVVAAPEYLMNHDGEETCLAIAVRGDRAWIIITTFTGARFPRDAEPWEVQVHCREGDAARLAQIARVCWWLARASDQRPPPEPDDDMIGAYGVLSDHMLNSGLLVDDPDDPGSGLLVACKRYAHSIPLPNRWSSLHLHDCGRWLIGQVVDPVRRGLRRADKVDDGSLRRLLDPAQAPAPWWCLGHAAIQAAVDGHADLLPLIDARIDALTPLGEQAAAADRADRRRLSDARWLETFGALPGLLPGQDRTDREVAGMLDTLSLRQNLERLQAARDRLAAGDDLELLAAWVRDERFGATWAEQRLLERDPAALIEPYAERLMAMITDRDRNDQAMARMWDLVLAQAPERATELARLVPADDPGHRLFLHAFDLLAPSDPGQRRSRLPALLHAIRHNGSGWGIERYVDAVVPPQDPLRYRDQAIDLTLVQAIGSSEPETTFPAACARALLRRNHPEAPALILQQAQRRLEWLTAQHLADDNMGFRAIDRFAVQTLAALAHQVPEHRHDAAALVDAMLLPHLDGRWHQSLVYAWVADCPGVKALDPWPTGHGRADPLHRAWLGRPAAGRLRGLWDLAALLRHESDPLLLAHWRDRWQSTLAEIPGDQHHGIGTNYANEVRRLHRAGRLEALRLEALQSMGVEP